MKDNPHYVSYEVIDVEQSRIPSYFKYKVLFKRGIATEDDKNSDTN